MITKESSIAAARKKYYLRSIDRVLRRIYLSVKGPSVVRYSYPMNSILGSSCRICEARLDLRRNRPLILWAASQIKISIRRHHSLLKGWRYFWAWKHRAYRPDYYGHGAALARDISIDASGTRHDSRPPEPPRPGRRDASDTSDEGSGSGAEDRAHSRRECLLTPPCAALRRKSARMQN